MLLYAPESLGTIRDREPRTATSIFTDTAPELWKWWDSSQVLLQINVALRPQRQYYFMDYYGRGAQNGHLDFHTAQSRALKVVRFFFFFSSSSSFSSSSFFSSSSSSSSSSFFFFFFFLKLILLYVHRDHILRTITDRKPRTATSIFIQWINRFAYYCICRWLFSLRLNSHIA